MNNESNPGEFWETVFGAGEGTLAWRSVPLKSGERAYWHAAARILGAADEVQAAAVALRGPDGGVVRLRTLERSLVAGAVANADDVLDMVRDAVDCADDEEGSAAVKSYMAGWVCADVVGRCLHGEAGR